MDKLTSQLKQLQISYNKDLQRALSQAKQASDSELQALLSKHEEELKSAERSDDQCSITACQVGLRVIFLPYEPGIYVGLVLPEFDPEQMLSDTQSVSSLASNAGVKLMRQKTDVRTFLDLASLPAKIQLILSKFEMIVIGKVTAVRVEEEETKDCGEIETIMD